MTRDVGAQEGDPTTSTTEAPTTSTTEAPTTSTTEAPTTSTTEAPTTTTTTEATEVPGQLPLFEDGARLTQGEVAVGAILAGLTGGALTARAVFR